MEKSLFFLVPATKKVFDLMEDDKLELSTESDSSINKIVSDDEQWLEESKTRLLKQFLDDISANLILSKMGKQVKK